MTKVNGTPKLFFFKFFSLKRSPTSFLLELLKLNIMQVNVSPYHYFTKVQY